MSDLMHFVCQIAKSPSVISKGYVNRFIGTDCAHPDTSISSPHRWRFILKTPLIASLCLFFYAVTSVTYAQDSRTRHPQIATAIPGAPTPSEAVANAKAGKVDIPEAFWQDLQPLGQHWDMVDPFKQGGYRNVSWLMQKESAKV